MFVRTHHLMYEPSALSKFSLCIHDMLQQPVHSRNDMPAPRRRRVCAREYERWLQLKWTSMHTCIYSKYRHIDRPNSGSCMLSFLNVSKHRVCVFIFVYIFSWHLWWMQVENTLSLILYTKSSASEYNMKTCLQNQSDAFIQTNSFGKCD